jgi:predicted transposase YbfD/YdcC
MSNGYSLLRYLGNESALAHSGESHDKNARSSNEMLIRSKTMSAAAILYLAGAPRDFSVLRHSQWDRKTEGIVLGYL